jgi:hypothetical protein
MQWQFEGLIAFYVQVLYVTQPRNNFQFRFLNLKLDGTIIDPLY